VYDYSLIYNSLITCTAKNRIVSIQLQ